MFGIAIASLVAQGAAAPNPQQQQSTAAIPCRWIVTLKLGIDKSDVKQHLDWIHDTHRRSLSRRQTTGIERTFGIGNFHGYTGEFDQQLLAEIEAKDEVRVPGRDEILDDVPVIDIDTAPLRSLQSSQIMKLH